MPVAASGLVSARALALPVRVSIRLLVEATAVLTLSVASLSLVSSIVTLPAFAASPALVRMLLRLSASPRASACPVLAAVLMAWTMPATT